MGALLVLVVIVLVLLALGLVMFKRLRREGDQRRDEAVMVLHPLRYQVPAEQDPAAALVALSRHGFEAFADPDDVHALVIMCPLGNAQREEVRIVLENQAMQTPDEEEQMPTATVRFLDER
jgi:hypothetical protein